MHKSMVFSINKLSLESYIDWYFYTYLVAVVDVLDEVPLLLFNITAALPTSKKSLFLSTLFFEHLPT
jgi:hypothetical protein